MKLISEKMWRGFWRLLDSWLFDLELLAQRQAEEDARGYAVILNLVAISREIASDGDFIDRFNEITSGPQRGLVNHLHACGGAEVIESSPESEAEFLYRYLNSIHLTWWQWIFYPVRTTRIWRYLRADLSAQDRNWLAYSVEADLRALEFGSLAPTAEQAYTLRRTVDSLGIPVHRLSSAFRSMAVSRMQNGLQRREPNAVLTKLCRVGRDGSFAAAALWVIASALALNASEASVILVLAGLFGLTVPVLALGFMLHKLGPEWTEAYELISALDLQDTTI